MMAMLRRFMADGAAGRPRHLSDRRTGEIARQIHDAPRER